MNAIVNPFSPDNPLPAKTLVLVGMPGSGKSSVGRKLAKYLALPFADSDMEVEKAAGMKIEQIFDRLGEPAFREGEKKVIARLLEGPPHVLATGGGALLNEETHDLIKKNALSVWLQADIDTLLERTMRRNNRPLLKRGDPEETLKKLLAAREPLYATADVTVISDHRPVEETANRVLEAISLFVRKTAPPAAPK